MRTDLIVPCLLVKNDEYWLPYTLRAVQGMFSRFVIYDVGSEDATRNILEQFIEAEKEECSFVYRPVPHCDPIIQGTFRNAMIAEAKSDWYLILDADEVYRRNALTALVNHMPQLISAYESEMKLYGVIRRYEVSHNLKSIHGLDEFVKHHRVYHRTAIWEGTHPGERAVTRQDARTEHFFPETVGCYHFHQPDRSRLDERVPRRISRRYQKTYLRGKPKEVDILNEIPILQKRIGNFPVNPELEKLWKS